MGRIVVPDPGLASPKFDCFANALVQAAAHSPSIRAVLTQYSFNSPRVAALAAELTKLRSASTCGKSIVKLGNAVRSGLDKGMQHDSQEVLGKMLLCAEDHGDSAFSSLFQGSVKLELKCRKCGARKTAQEGATGTLTVPVIPVVDGRVMPVDACLGMSFPEKDVVDYKCECKHVKTGPQNVDHDASRTWAKHPQVLCVQVMRFELDRKLGPDDGLGLLGSTSLSLGGKKYQLRCVVQHIGADIEEGHYVCHAKIRCGGGDISDGTWWLFNDASVALGSAAEALREPYLMFYEQLGSEATCADLCTLLADGSGASEQPQPREHSSGPGCAIGMAKDDAGMAHARAQGHTPPPTQASSEKEAGVQETTDRRRGAHKLEEAAQSEDATTQGACQSASGRKVERAAPGAGGSEPELEEKPQLGSGSGPGGLNLYNKALLHIGKTFGAGREATLSTFAAEERISEDMMPVLGKAYCEVEKWRAASLRRLGETLAKGGAKPRPFNVAQQCVKIFPGHSFEEVCASLASVWPSSLSPADIAMAQRGFDVSKARLHCQARKDEKPPQTEEQRAGDGGCGKQQAPELDTAKEEAAARSAPCSHGQRSGAGSPGDAQPPEECVGSEASCEEDDEHGAGGPHSDGEEVAGDAQGAPGRAPEHGAGRTDASDVLRFLQDGSVPKGQSKKALTRASANYSYDEEEDKLYYTFKSGEVVRVLTSQEEKSEVLRHAHSSDLAGHFGVNKTHWAIRKQGKTFWHGLFEEVEEYVRSCEVCQKRNSTSLKQTVPLRTIKLPKHAMRLIGVDVKRMPLSSEGYRYLVVAIDYHSKYTFARPLKSKTAAEIAAFLFEDIFCMCGFVRYMITDNGGEFRNQEVAQLLGKKLGIQQRFTAPYSPQTNGLVERANGIIAGVLSKVLKGENGSWPAHLHQALYAMRHSVHTSTGFAPSSLLFGRDVVSVLYVVAHGVPKVDEEELIRQLEEEKDVEREEVANAKDEFLIKEEYKAARSGSTILGVADRPADVVPKRPPGISSEFLAAEGVAKKMREDAAVQQEKASSRNAANYNRRHGVVACPFAPGQLVLERGGQLTHKMHGKLSLRCAGPYRVLQVVGSAVTIMKNGKHVVRKPSSLKAFYTKRTGA